MNTILKNHHAVDTCRDVKRILIASAGRRNYLVDWFREALNAGGRNGLVYAADASRTAPSRYSANHFIELPPLGSSSYLPELLRVCKDQKIDLALSLNDYENSVWAELNLRDYDQGTTFLCLDADVQKVFEDKLAFYRAFHSAGVKVPRTISATDALNDWDSTHQLGGEIVIKNRFGSGSYGLCRTTAAHLRTDLNLALSTVKDHRGMNVPSVEAAADNLVLQQLISGSESGLDVVNDFESDFVGCLVRRKLAMREGETSAAVTSPSGPFTEIAKALSRYSRHKGIIDTDVITDDSGDMWVIDVNPRFGGGYPFSHYAGANIPALYVRWLHDEDFDAEQFLTYGSDVTSHKTISLIGDR